MLPETRSCQACENRFSVEADDIAFYQKMEVPAPTWCPSCRTQRRLMWRAERALYRRKSDLTGKEIFSTYHPEAPVVVYENEEWWTDKWEGLEYGKDIDWNKPFLQQVIELARVVPRPARSVFNLENSDYSNNAGQLKDCYLVFTGQNDESSYYSVALGWSRDCMDCNYVFESELCYWCVNCTKCYGRKYSVDCENSQNLWFCKNLVNSSDCFGCVNVRNKRFCIFNQQYAEEEYKQKLAEFHLGSRSAVNQMWKKVLEFQSQFPVKFAHENQNENCTGENISNSKNVQQSYFVGGGENMKYCQMVMVPSTQDSYDYCFWGGGSQLIYECVNVGYDPSRLKFCYEMYPACSDSEYSMYSTSSSDLFGCVGLRNKKFCILNKQYTEEEYKQLVTTVRQYMKDMPYTDQAGRVFAYGEFFPSECMPYGYNESLAYELFPLTKEEAQGQAIPWRELEPKQFEGALTAEQVPNNISAISVDTTKQAIQCEHASTCKHNCNGAFKFLPQEIQFYQTHGIPLPTLCPSCRHYQRIPFRNLPQLRQSVCDCQGIRAKQGYSNLVTHEHGTNPCGTQFVTAYAL